MESIELDASLYQTPTGVDDMLNFIRQRINVTDLKLEVEVFEIIHEFSTEERWLHEQVH